MLIYSDHFRFSETKPECLKAGAFSQHSRQVIVFFKKLALGTSLLIFGMYLTAGLPQSQPAQTNPPPTAQLQHPPQHKAHLEQPPGGPLQNQNRMELDSLLIRLTAGPASRLSRVDIAFQVSSPQAKADLANSINTVRDHLVFILSAQDESVFASNEQKTLLEQEISRQLNLFLPSGQVEQTFLKQTFLN